MDSKFPPEILAGLSGLVWILILKLLNTMSCPEDYSAILKKLWNMQTGENKETSWDDVEIRVGGRKIYGVTNLALGIDGIKENGVLTDDKIYAYTGAISLSKKNLHQLRKLCMAKKVRLPRKLKKRLEKQLKDDRQY
jgi:hypothetical protein